MMLAEVALDAAARRPVMFANIIQYPSEPCMVPDFL